MARNIGNIGCHEKEPVSQVDHDKKAEDLVAADQQKRHGMAQIRFILVIFAYDHSHRTIFIICIDLGRHKLTNFND